MKFLALPNDVYSMIWSNLDLASLMNLRQTCKAFSTAISNDKQLWIRILDIYVKERSLPIPSNLCDVEDAEARDIESWVKHAIMLNDAYNTPGRKLQTSKIEIRQGLRVSWLKLVLGRWCLVAASNDKVSELSVWDTLRGGGPRDVGRIYLEAPIIDGMVDVCGGEVRCAITVGTNQPYILVLGLFHSPAGVVLRQLSWLSGASSILFFRGEFVGFAVRDGDDAYPYLWHWRTGDIHRLYYSHDKIEKTSSPEPIESCKALTIYNGYILSLHRSAIHVFSTSSTFHGDFCIRPTHVYTCPLQDTVACGEFITDDSMGLSPTGQWVEVHVVFQELRSRLRRLVISRSSEKDPFVVEEAALNYPRNLGVRHLYQYKVGSSGKMVAGSTCLVMRRCRNPVLSLGALHSDRDYVQVSREGLPLLHLLSCLDFDDANGLLLMCSSSGDVRFASFLSDKALTRGSVQSSLTSTRFVESLPIKIHRAPVSLDLPLYYTIRGMYKLEDGIPPEYMHQVVSRWRDDRITTRSFSGWSNNWQEFEMAWAWIVSIPFWGPSDTDFMYHAPTFMIRMRLQTFGEIIPVLYNVNNHYRVVFRIGQRMFYSRTERDVEDTEGEEEFEMYGDGILGVLPVTYDQYLNDPALILNFISNFGIQTNLHKWYCSAIPEDQYWLAYFVRRIREYCERDLNMQIDDSVMADWSDEEWEKYYFPALGIRYYEFWNDLNE